MQHPDDCIEDEFLVAIGRQQAKSDPREECGDSSCHRPAARRFHTLSTKYNENIKTMNALLSSLLESSGQQTLRNLQRFPKGLFVGRLGHAESNSTSFG